MFCPDLSLEFTRLLMKAGEGRVCPLIVSHAVWVVVSFDLRDELTIGEMLR